VQSTRIEAIDSAVVPEVGRLVSHDIDDGNFRKDGVAGHIPLCPLHTLREAQW
jgi:hypothetical protein